MSDFRTIHQKSGFTIIELLIATTVFSVILIIITTGIIRITQMYEKGINLINTQNTARSVMDSISQAIQFNGGVISWPPSAAAGGVGCIGNREYNFQLGQKLENNGVSDGTGDWQAAYALVSNPNKANCTESAILVPPSPGTTEMLSPHMRLTQLNVIPVSGADTDRLYQVSVTVVYGDYDLLCDTTYSAGSHGSCGQGSPPIQPGDPNFHAFLTSQKLACRSGDGAPYCAVSTLSTVVQQRLTAD